MTGKIFFRERDITDLEPYQRARLGIARSFQITNIFGQLSVYENVRLGVQAVNTTAKRTSFCRRRTERRDLRTSDRIASSTTSGCGTRAIARAENLSHGDQRRLEIGLVLASDPPVLLLDEPLAGMSPTETHETVELIHAHLARAHDSCSSSTTSTS